MQRMVKEKIVKCSEKLIINLSIFLTYVTYNIR